MQGLFSEIENNGLESEKPRITSIKWTDAERYQLFKYVEENKQYGRKNNWIECAKMIGTKTSRQCYDCYNLSNFEKNGKKHKWTDEEVRRLMTIQTVNMSWREFQRIQFPEFSVSQLKNKYKQVQMKLRQHSENRSISSDDATPSISHSYKTVSPRRVTQTSIDPQLFASMRAVSSLPEFPTEWC